MSTAKSLARRNFLKKAGTIAGGFVLAGSLPSFIIPEANQKFKFKISLAEWSLHRALFNRNMTNLDFPKVAREDFGIEAIEYVSQFFKDKAKDLAYLKILKGRCKDQGVESLLIMVDQEGSLASTDAKARKKAVENHYKWVEAAKFLECHSIRVNLHGEGSNKEDWKKASVESLGMLAEFCAAHKMNVLVENHGQLSSNGKLLAEVIQEVNNPHCGTLPDFGNFCMRREKGDLWESPCVDWYNRYQGVEEMLPFAKGISAKSFAFDENGNETSTDFRKMLKLVRNAGYKGYIGIEYEGDSLSEKDGILKTKELLEKIRQELS